MNKFLYYVWRLLPSKLFPYKVSVESQSFNVKLRYYWVDVNNGLWEPFLFNLLNKYVNYGDTILDLGAWRGAVSLYCAKQGARCISVEPDIVALKDLRTNISLNKDITDRIQYYNLCVADSNGSRFLSSNKFGNSMSSIVGTKKNNSKEIESVTIDKLLTLNNTTDLNFIKIDIEGAEFEILSGLVRVLRENSLPHLYIALHFGALPIDFSVSDLRELFYLYDHSYLVGAIPISFSRFKKEYFEKKVSCELFFTNQPYPTSK